MEQYTKLKELLLSQQEIQSLGEDKVDLAENTAQTFNSDKISIKCGCAVVKLNGTVAVLRLPVTYEQLISGIVKARYSSDRAEAITANYLEALDADEDDTKAQEHIAEYRDYQAWRTLAKATAKEAMGGTSED